MKETFLQLLNQFLPDLLYILALVAIYYLRKIVSIAVQWFEAHTTAAQRKTIKDLGHEAFVYAETVFREKNGADKLQEALKYFNAQMSRYGLSNLTFDIIRAAIEKAWLADKGQAAATNITKIGGTE